MLEGPQRFLGGFALGHLPLEVGPPFAWVADLTDGDQMDGVVERRLRPGIEPVSQPRSAQGFHGAVAL